MLRRTPRSFEVPQDDTSEDEMWPAGRASTLRRSSTRLRQRPFDRFDDHSRNRVRRLHAARVLGIRISSLANPIELKKLRLLPLSRLSDKRFSVLGKPLQLRRRQLFDRVLEPFRHLYLPTQTIRLHRTAVSVTGPSKPEGVTSQFDASNGL